MKLIKNIIFIAVLINFSFLSAKVPTIGLMQHSAGSLDSGYVLFTQLNNKQTYLLNKCGYMVQKWESAYKPGYSVYLLSDGNLLRTGNLANKEFWAGGSAGIIEKIDWDSKVIWSYKISSSNLCSHHDIKPLPNGNILVIAWDKKSPAEALALGREPVLVDSCVWNDKIIELKPIGKDSAEIVWEWSAWDHLVQYTDPAKPNYHIISSHPERININYADETSKIDWLHINSVDYNSKLDQILLSSLYFNEIWIIDHSTTTAQARTSKGGNSDKGGDLLYRWGNPLAYEKGTSTNQRLFSQHDASWIPQGFPDAGKIMIFNNCRGTKANPYSSVDIIVPPVDSFGKYGTIIPFGPDSTYWSYTAPIPHDFYAMNLSSGQQLSNGNVLICNGFTGTFFELDTNKEIVWEYINPVGPTGPFNQGTNPIMNLVFRCTFYPSSYSAFKGKELLPIGLIENENVNSSNCTLAVSVEDTENLKDFSVYPNPSNEYINIETLLTNYNVSIIDLQGKIIFKAENPTSLNTNNLENGIYLISIKSKAKNPQFLKLIINR